MDSLSTSMLHSFKQSCNWCRRIPWEDDCIIPVPMFVSEVVQRASLRTLEQHCKDFTV